MFVRARKNANGSTSVLVINSKRVKGKKNPQPIVVKHFGTTSNSADADALLAQARAYLQKRQRAALVRKSLDDAESCRVINTGFSHFYGTIFDRRFSSCDYLVDKQMLRDLSVMRIAHPVSKLKTSRIAEKSGLCGFDINKIYRFMDALKDEAIERVKLSVYQNTKRLLGSDSVRVFFYDLTTIYFEANESSDLKEFGFFKDGKHQHVQISLALIVTEHGLPIGYELFKGNTFEGNTLIPTLTKLRTQYDIGRVVIVADSALMSSRSLELIRGNGFEYVVAARIRSLGQKLTDEVTNIGNYAILNEDIRCKTIDLNDHAMIAYHSQIRARKDEYERALSIKRAEKYLGSSAKTKLTGALNKPYIDLTPSSTISMNESKLEASKKLDGFFGLYSNIKHISPDQLLAQYKGLWQVEATFRITKHNLSIRPVYHWKDRRIKAHFAICFMSLALIRTAEYLLAQNNTPTPIEALHEMLQEIQAVQITDGQQVTRFLADIPEQMHAIYAAIQIPTPTHTQK